MNSLINYFKRFGDLNAAHTKLLSELVVVKNMGAHDYFLSAGDYCNRIGFIQEGVFRISFYNKEGDEITRYFLKENQFVVDLYAFQNQVVSGEYVQSVTESKLLILSREALTILSQKVPCWDTMIHSVTQHALMEKLYNRSDLVSKDAKTKYLDFVKENPGLVNRIPLGYLASYLGIRQQSLSRIRNQIAQKGAF